MKAHAEEVSWVLKLFLIHYAHILTHTTYISIHVHSHTRTYPYTCISIHVYNHIRIYPYTYIYTRTHTYTCNVYTRTYTFTHSTYISIGVHINTHTYLHLQRAYPYTYIYTRTHTYTCNVHTYTHKYMHTSTYICLHRKRGLVVAVRPRIGQERKLLTSCPCLLVCLRRSRVKIAIALMTGRVVVRANLGAAVVEAALLLLLIRD